jgi:hypothetical protein
VLSLAQSFRSPERSISSAVQKLASCFLYICQMLSYFIGNSTNLCLLSVKSGSASSAAPS